jgi:hypothetical protein
MSDQGGHEVEVSSNGGGGQADGAQPSSLDKLVSSFEQFQARTAGQLDALAQRFEPEEPEDFIFDAGQLEHGTDYELTDDGVLRALEQRVREEALDQVAGLRDAPSQMEATTQFAALEARYPELRDDSPFQDEFVSIAHEYAQAIGRPDLVTNPVFCERLYLSLVAERAGEDEIPAGSERGVQLERSGAAGGGGGSQEPDVEDAMVAAYRGQRHRISR